MRGNKSKFQIHTGNVFLLSTKKYIHFYALKTKLIGLKVPTPQMINVNAAVIIPVQSWDMFLAKSSSVTQGYKALWYFQNPLSVFQGD